MDQTWHLRYDVEWTACDSPHPSVDRRSKKLKATTREEAIVEARSVWKEVTRDGALCTKEQPGGYYDYLYGPRLSYEEPLPIENAP